MQIRWRGLELPTRACLDADTASSTYGLFVVEPFERGFGVTVGNSLRRILLMLPSRSRTPAQPY